MVRAHALSAEQIAAADCESEQRYREPHAQGQMWSSNPSAVTATMMPAKIPTRAATRFRNEWGECGNVDEAPAAPALKENHTSPSPASASQEEVRHTLRTRTNDADVEGQENGITTGEVQPAASVLR